MAKHAKDLGTTAAAARLGVTSQTVRDWIDAGDLNGQKRNGKWFVEAKSLAKYEKDHPPRTAQAPSGDVQQQLAQLTAIVDGLVERDRAAGDRLAAIEDERDRYRAEAAAAKEVALRVNAAAREAGEGTRKLLEALELQADALSQFLAPGSPADLLDR